MKVMKTMKTMVLALIIGLMSELSMAQSILIKNVSIFDGENTTLITGKDVVIKDNLIEKLVDAGGKEKGFDQVIDGKGGLPHTRTH